VIPEIELYPSGEFFNPLEPDSSKIHITDIAHALSMKCRFTGHCKRFISVAEHSVVVSKLVDRQDAKAALLHDCAEAYLPDVASPVKQQATYALHKIAENHLEDVIFIKFGVIDYNKKAVKLVDNVCVGVEALFNLNGFDSSPNWEWVRDIHDVNQDLVARAINQYRYLSPIEARNLFMKRWKEVERI